jgi:hypothetical protein
MSEPGQMMLSIITPGGREAYAIAPPCERTYSSCTFALRSAASSSLPRSASSALQARS